MAYITINDFKTGKYKLSDAGSNQNYTELTAAILLHENNYIYKLFGATEGKKIINYSGTGNAEYDTAIAAFTIDNTDSCGPKFYQSLGLKEYLKAAIFYEYTKSDLKFTGAGLIKKETEIGTKQSPAATLRAAQNKFNDVLNTIAAIQWYCTVKKPDAFPDFNGEEFFLKTPNSL